MEIKIGEKIIELRKAKGMTQEQLASLLGVSAPAVSKWETDSSYPDITLLCPLARALGTDVDTLLSYEETLSEEKQGQYMTELMATLNAGREEEAEERLEQLLHSYPSAVSLKFSAIAVFSMLEMRNPDWGEGGELREDISENIDSPNSRRIPQNQGTPQNKDDLRQKRARWKARKKALAEALCESGDSVFYLPAISMLVTLELADGNLDRAEELLTKTITNTEDFTILWVQLYQKKGETDKALATIQRNLNKLIAEMRTCLMTLLGNQMGFDRKRTLEICDIFRRQEEMFGVGGGTGAGVIAEVYLRLGMKQEALNYLEQFANRLTDGLTLPNQALFYPTYSPETMQLAIGNEIKQSVLLGLEQDDCFAPLRGEESFQAIIRKLKES